LTLPNYQDFPPEPSQRLLISEVPLSVLGELFQPEAQFGFGPPPAARVLMPETAVDKDHFSQPRKNDVRFAGQVIRMQPVSKAHRVNEAADAHFWLSVFAAHARHPLASLLFGESVHRHRSVKENIPETCGFGGGFRGWNLR
jgi:hypothetical protein